MTQSGLGARSNDQHQVLLCVPSLNRRHDSGTKSINDSHFSSPRVGHFDSRCLRGIQYVGGVIALDFPHAVRGLEGYLVPAEGLQWSVARKRDAEMLCLLAHRDSKSCQAYRVECVG